MVSSNSREQSVGRQQAGCIISISQVGRGSRLRERAYVREALQTDRVVAAFDLQLSLPLLGAAERSADNSTRTAD